MGRIGTTSLLIVALVIGGMFEVAKRLSWVAARPSSELAGIGQAGRPSSQSNDRFAKIPGQVARHSRALKATALSQRGIMIPPTHGQFDSATPKADSNQKIAKAHKDATDKTKKKKCKKAKEDSEQLPEDLARSVKPEPAAPLSAAALAAQTRARLNNTDGVKKDETAKEDTSEDEICEEEDSKVAKKDAAEAETPEEKKPENNMASDTPTVIAGAAAGNNNENNELAGLEEWKARVLDQPNFKETVRLIEAVQSGQISSTLFYTIVKLMLEDGRPEMRELGILAAGRTPSTESYHLLVDVIKHESFSSKLRQRAEAELNIYEQISYLWILENIMRASTDVFSVIWATKQLEDSARRYLNAKYNRPIPPSGGGQPTTRNPYVNQFNRFITVLQELSTTKGGGEASIQAKQTLQSLQDLIKAVS